MRITTWPVSTETPSLPDAVQGTKQPYRNPGASYVYRLFDANDTLLYIGIATAPLERWRSHYGTSWWSTVVRAHLQFHEDRKSAERAEIEAIGSEHPKHNKLHSEQNGLALSAVRAQLPKLITSAVHRREITYITKNGRRVAAIVPTCPECGEALCQTHDAPVGPRRPTASHVVCTIEQ